MILTFAYPGPFFSNEVKVTSSDNKSVSVFPNAKTFSELTPPGQGPWSVFIGSSTVVRDVEQADAMVVYQGQTSTICTPV